MLEQVYETIRGILFYELPKNNNGKPVVYDRVIEQFLLGDQEVQPSQPSIVLKGSSSQPVKIAHNLYKVTHKLTIQTWSQNDTREIAERVSQEMARIVFEALFPHKRIWVLIKCPICNKKIMSPLHFTTAHASIFSPYVTTVTTDLTNTWLETHSSSDPIPSFVDSGVVRAAYDLLSEDVRNSITVTGLSNQARDRILYYQSDKRRPIRFLYNVDMTEIKPSDDGLGKQILHSSEFSIMFEELIKQTTYGPDNVPTDSWD